MHCRFVPDIHYPVLAIELSSHPQPFVARYGPLTVAGEVRHALGLAVLVCVCGEPLKSLGRRKIPHVIRREVLSRGGVSDPAGRVGAGKGKSGPLPLVPQPFLHAQRPGGSLKSHLAHVLDTDLSHDRKLPQCLRIAIARNMPQALVPDVAIPIFPPGLGQHGMHRRPSDFRVPKPKRRFRRRGPGPRTNVRLIPLGQPAIGGRIALKARYPVCPIRHDHRRRRPSPVQVQRVSGCQNYVRCEYHANPFFTDFTGERRGVQFQTTGGSAPSPRISRGRTRPILFAVGRGETCP